MTYPTDEQLRRIRAWPADDLTGWLAFVRAAGHWWSMTPPWGWTEDAVCPTPCPGGAAHLSGRMYRVSTGGWSGNEEILGAMEDNVACWLQCWEATSRGGHYEFRVSA